ncbi:MAG: hypothetical protein KJ648_00190, partial [Candidatus Omnitrophica bacterium]|nr:hypothetical protein [Candidatus Omnitrophota bacterium]
GIGVGPFFSIFPQKSKLTIAPLRLTPKDLLDIDCPFRDITGKKYTMGGLVRVACHKCDEADLGMAFDLAKKSFEIKKKVGPAAFFGDDKGE